jgi:hypothetical protein
VAIEMALAGFASQAQFIERHAKAGRPAKGGGSARESRAWMGTHHEGENLRARYTRCGNAVGLGVVAVGSKKSGELVGDARGQSTAQAGSPSNMGAPTSYEASHFPKREHSYYELFCGVDSLSAKAVESGELIKFSYRVLDAEKAKTLNDKGIQPVLYDPAIRAKLVIPTLEKVGQLRQAQTPEPGKI